MDLSNFNFQSKKTIVAVATANINQTLAIIRLSGDNSFQIFQKIFSKKVTYKGGVFVVGKIFDFKIKKIIDEVVVLFYQKPKSFTGENTVEIICHGNPIIVHKIIYLLIKSGAVLAKQGEFCWRAFLNKKITLLQAETINELVKTKSSPFCRSLANNLNNKQYLLFKKMKSELEDLFTHNELEIIYPEWDEKNQKENVIKNILTKINGFLKTILKVIKLNEDLTVLKEGIKTVIIGKPNVGKSTLLNALISEEKAIVSSLPGTTRDFVEGEIDLGNLQLKLIDTAGIRKTKEKLEKIAIKKTKEKLFEASLLLIIIDGNKRLSADDEIVFNIISKLKLQQKVIVTINKKDLKTNIDLQNKHLKEHELVFISAKKKETKELVSKIKEKFLKNNLTIENELLLTNLRQFNCLLEIKDNLQKLSVTLKKALKNEITWSTDLLYLNFQELINSLNFLIGEEVNFDVFSKIFQNFCIGK